MEFLSHNKNILTSKTLIFHELLQSFSEPERLLLRGRIEQGAEFQDLADQLGYSSVWAARRAFYAAQTKLLIRFQQRRSD